MPSGNTCWHPQPGGQSSHMASMQDAKHPSHGSELPERGSCFWNWIRCHQLQCSAHGGCAHVVLVGVLVDADQLALLHEAPPQLPELRAQQATHAAPEPRAAEITSSLGPMCMPLPWRQRCGALRLLLQWSEAVRVFRAVCAACAAGGWSWVDADAACWHLWGWASQMRQRLVCVEVCKEMQRTQTGFASQVPQVLFYASGANGGRAEAARNSRSSTLLLTASDGSA